MKENFILDMKKVKIPVNSTLDKYAKENRKNMTDEEKKVWYQILRGREPKFHRQRIIGNYIVDFYFVPLMIISLFVIYVKVYFQRPLFSSIRWICRISSHNLLHRSLHCIPRILPVIILIAIIELFLQPIHFF